MPDNEMKIILSLDDQVSAGLQKTSSIVEDFSRKMKSVGREISQVGSTISMTGGIITGVFGVAIKNASKNVGEVNQVMMEMQNTMTLFQEKVARSVVPVLQEFARVINNLYTAFNSLSPSLQNSIIQGTLMAGVFLTLGGGVLFLIGKVTSLIANIGLLTSSFIAFAAANPILLTVAGIVVAIGAAMLRWKWVADTVLSTFEVLFLTIKNGFLTIKMVMEEVMAGILSGWSNMINTLAMIPNPMQDQMRAFAMQLESASTLMRRLAYDDMQGIITNAETMGNVLKTGEGSWSKGFDNLKVSIKAAKDELINGNSVVAQSNLVWKKNFDGIVSAANNLNTAMQGAAQMSKSWAAAAKAVALMMAIVNTAQGVTRALAEYPWPFSMIVGAIVAAAGAIQIATISSAKLAEGTDTVPAMLSPGEMVFPRTMADAIRRGDISVSGRGSGNSSQTININISNPVVSSLDAIDSLANEISRRLARETERI